MAFIETKGVCKEFVKRHRITAVSDLDLKIAKNESVSIIGLSG